VVFGSKDDPFAPGGYCDQFPFDPICSDPTFWESLPPVIFISEPGPSEPTINVTVTGPSGADVTQAVDNSLGDLWDATVGAVDAVVAEAVNAIQDAVTAIANALKAAWGILSRLAGLILGFLQKLLADVIAGIVKVLEEARDLAQGLYKKVLLPIVNGLGNVRNALMDIYRRFIRPMLIVLQDLRQLLAILAAFHIRFAQKLDQKLTELEYKITQPLFYLLSFVNGVANWVNLIVTAGYLLQKSVFLNSLFAYVGEALNLQLNAMNQPPGAAAIGAANAANKTQSQAQSAADMNSFLAGSGGPIPADLAPYGAQLDQYLSQGLS